MEITGRVFPLRLIHIKRARETCKEEAKKTRKKKNRAHDQKRGSGICG